MGDGGGIEHVALHRGDSRPQPHLQRMPAIGQWRRARPKQPPDRIGLCGPEGLPVHVDTACPSAGVSACRLRAQEADIGVWQGPIDSPDTTRRELQMDVLAKKVAIVTGPAPA